MLVIPLILSNKKMPSIVLIDSDLYWAQRCNRRCGTRGRMSGSNHRRECAWWVNDDDIYQSDHKLVADEAVVEIIRGGGGGDHKN